MNDIELVITERLAKERREREARLRAWDLVDSVFGHIDPQEIRVESNALDLGQFGASYLEQVQITLPEVYPGMGHTMCEVIRHIPSLLKYLQRDMMTDAERVQIGWADLKLTVTDA